VAPTGPLAPSQEDTISADSLPAWLQDFELFHRNPCPRHRWPCCGGTEGCYVLVPDDPWLPQRHYCAHCPGAPGQTRRTDQ